MMKWIDEIGFEDFAIHTFKLQYQAGLTFKEACVTLTPNGYMAEWAEEWGCTIENVCNLRRKAWKKIQASGVDQDEVSPTYFYHIF